MTHNFDGKYVVLGGLDGIGKGTGIRALVEHEISQGKKVLDVDSWQKERGKDPPILEILDYDVVVCSEPTYALGGKHVREELIANKNKGKYTAMDVAHGFSKDRHRALLCYVLPALAMGKRVIQSRSVETSLVYQPVQAEENGEELDVEMLMELGGNMFALQYGGPDLMIIPTIENAKECIGRLRSRTDKDDDSYLESVNLQLKFKPRYESKWFKSIFEDRETRVVYIDAGISPEHTASETLRMYREFLRLQ